MNALAEEAALRCCIRNKASMRTAALLELVRFGSLAGQGEAAFDCASDRSKSRSAVPLILDAFMSWECRLAVRWLVSCAVRHSPYLPRAPFIPA